MALQKSITLDTGITAEYHKVSRTDIDWHNSSARITVQSYVSDELRLQGAAPICTLSFDFFDDTFPFTESENVQADVYGAIKTAPMFNDAIDV